MFLGKYGDFSVQSVKAEAVWDTQEWCADTRVNASEAWEESWADDMDQALRDHICGGQKHPKLMNFLRSMIKGWGDLVTLTEVEYTEPQRW